MNIEPLENILKIYNDKNKVLFYYLPEKTIEKIKEYKFVDDLDTLFLNDKISGVYKNSGMFFKSGNIIKITKDCIMIKSTRNINLNKKGFYFFKYEKSNKSSRNNKKFYEELLKSLS